MSPNPINHDRCNCSECYWKEALKRFQLLLQSLLQQNTATFNDTEEGSSTNAGNCLNVTLTVNGEERSVSVSGHLMERIFKNAILCNAFLNELEDVHDTLKRVLGKNATMNIPNLVANIDQIFELISQDYEEEGFPNTTDDDKSGTSSGNLETTFTSEGDNCTREDCCSSSKDNGSNSGTNGANKEYNSGYLMNHNNIGENYDKAGPSSSVETSTNERFDVVYGDNDVEMKNMYTMILPNCADGETITESDRQNGTNIIEQFIQIRIDDLEFEGNKGNNDSYTFGANESIRDSNREINDDNKYINDEHARENEIYSVTNNDDGGENIGKDNITDARQGDESEETICVHEEEQIMQVSSNIGQNETIQIAIEAKFEEDYPKLCENKSNIDATVICEEDIGCIIKNDGENISLQQECIDNKENVSVQIESNVIEGANGSIQPLCYNIEGGTSDNTQSQSAIARGNDINTGGNNNNVENRNSNRFPLMRGLSIIHTPSGGVVFVEEDEERRFVTQSNTIYPNGVELVPLDHGILMAIFARQIFFDFESDDLAEEIYLSICGDVPQPASEDTDSDN